MSSERSTDFVLGEINGKLDQVISGMDRFGSHMDEHDSRIRHLEIVTQDAPGPGPGATRRGAEAVGGASLVVLLAEILRNGGVIP